MTSTQNLYDLFATVLGGIDDGAKTGAHEAPPVPPPSPLVVQPEALFPMLCEHAVRSDVMSSPIVTAPVATLMTRAHVTADEAHIILQSLQAMGLLAQVGEWEGARIIDTRCLPIPLNEDSVSASPTGDVVIRRRQAVRGRSPITHTRYPTRDRRVLHARRTRWLGAPRARKLTVSATAYQTLLAQSTMIQGAPTVRSPLLVVQAEYKIGLAEAETLLERLFANGHIRQLDGWRAIVLLSRTKHATRVRVQKRRTSQPPTERTSTAHRSMPWRIHLRSGEEIACATEEEIKERVAALVCEGHALASITVWRLMECIVTINVTIGSS